MKNTSTFQIILMGVFIFFIVAGVIVFATYKSGNQTITDKVQIWGTIDHNTIDKLLSKLGETDQSVKNISYKQINVENFNFQFTEAMAEGNGPDAIILQQDSIFQQKNKILTIPYDSYSERDFKNQFIEEGELYLSNEGVIGLPFIVDPMVMYWNRDIFSKAGVAIPPKSWDEFFALSQKITEKDDNLNILKSFVSFGEFRNITHAKELLSSLIIQADDKIVSNETVSFGKDGSAEEAVDFFVQFSNPVKPVYSWNRSLPESQKMFISGNLAVYFGFASELNNLRVKNPNLNFDVATMPKTSKSGNVFGKMYSLAITKNSKNPGVVFSAIKILTGDEALKILSDFNGLPPVSRTLLSSKPSNPYQVVFYDSAILTKAWGDPSSPETNLIFQNMIESIISGRQKTKQAIDKASSEIQTLLQK